MDNKKLTAKCPFFVDGDKQVIKCEGGCIITFPDARASHDFFAEYCQQISGWEHCSIAANKQRYYDRRFGKE